MPSINFDKKFLFQVVALGVFATPLGFSKVSPIEVEVGEVAYYQGGTLIPHKYPGRLVFSDITLERGRVAQDSTILGWLGRVVDLTQLATNVNTGIAFIPDGTSDSATFKVDVNIIQYDRDGRRLKTTTVFQAWPKKYVEGEWDNEADEVNVETVILAYDYFNRTA